MIHSQRLDAVGRLAGGVAHDFNNLLSVINGYCEMMASKASIRKLASRELNEIHQASDKAAHWVAQLLAFSRRQPSNLRVVNLDQFVRENSAILSRLLRPARMLDFELKAESANVRVDTAQVQQVLLNLVLNARDALREGGRAVIETSVRETRPDDSQTGKHKRFAVLSVSDNGIGMTDEVRARLFEPFFTTKENGRGTGLGLALVYGVVQQCGGFVRVSSTPGAGSTFDIFLPLANSPAERRRRSLAPLPAVSGRERLLVVEEDKSVRKMVCDTFHAAGYDTIAAANTVEGLEALKGSPEKFDLVIAQTSAKQVPADEIFARALHVMQPEASVLTTGENDTGLFADINPEKRVFLAKPFTLSALLTTARQLIDGKMPVAS